MGNAADMGTVFAPAVLVRFGSLLCWTLGKDTWSEDGEASASSPAPVIAKIGEFETQLQQHCH